MSMSSAGVNCPLFHCAEFAFTWNPAMVCNFCLPSTVRSTAPGLLLTVTVTDDDDVVRPPASRAIAVSVWLPFEAVVVFQTTEYGAAVSSAPRLIPSTLNCTPATPTASVAVADMVTLVPETVAPLAGAVSAEVGGVVSRTVTVNAADAVLARASAAVQLTVVVAIANVVPLAGVHVAAAVGFGGGSVSVGAVVSRTVTVKLFVATFARVSVAEQVTVVVASGNVAPLAGVQLAATAPLTASVAVALNVTIAPAALVA